MRAFWPILRDRIGYLYDKGIRIVEAQAMHDSGGQIEALWWAWGLDGLLVDGNELGLDEALSEVASKITRGHDGIARLYIYPRGYVLKRRNWGEDWELVEERGVLGKYPLEPRPQLWYPLRERLRRLVARYPKWYRHDAPEDWREEHSPKPTPENIFEWGRAMEEWSVLEEPLVLGLLREILGKE